MIDIIEKQKKRRKKIKFTVEGFNQIEAIKLGLSTDDLVVLRWFVDYKSTDKMERKYIEKANDLGFWVDYSTLVDALPILLKDGNVYLERFLELERLLQEKRFDEYRTLKHKYHQAYRKKVQRILDGPLSQVLKKDKVVSLGKNKGSKIYVYLDREVYDKLLDDTNMETYLRDNGIKIKDVDNVDNVDNCNTSYFTGDKSDSSIGDKSDSSIGDKSDSSIGDKSDSSIGDKSDSSDSSITDSSITDSSISNKSINNPSSIDDLSLKYLINLKSKNQKISYLENIFDLTSSNIENILMGVNLGIEDGLIKCSKDSSSYWKYIYKTCKSRYEKKLTHNCSYELA